MIFFAGGSGNIGKPLCEHLYKNENVTILVNSSKKSDKSFIGLNLLDDEKTKDFANSTNKFDILIFLVGLAHKKGEKSNYEEFNNVNFITLKNLIEAFWIVFPSKEKSNFPVIFSITLPESFNSISPSEIVELKDNLFFCSSLFKFAEKTFFVLAFNILYWLFVATIPKSETCSVSVILFY